MHLQFLFSLALARAWKPLYTAPDGHRHRGLSALTPGELVQITEVRMSSDRSRAAGRTVLPNPDSQLD